MTTRVYQAVDLKTGQTLDLDSDASHHVGRVLRAKVGDDLIVFNGEGGEYSAVITLITKKCVTVELNAFHDRDTTSSLPLHLGQGLAKGEKMDWVIQKSVELGVAEITPLITERSNVKLPADRLAKKLAHWRQVAISACEQSGRTDVPVVHEPKRLDDWLKACQQPVFVFSPVGSVKLNEIDSKGVASASLLIGPEGGLSENELASLKDHFNVKLGPRVLRTETAAIAAVASLQLVFGDLS